MGSKRDHLCAVDANFDGRQAVMLFDRYARADEVDQLNVSHIGSVGPSRHLADFEPLPTPRFELDAPRGHPFNPELGTCAISASHLQRFSLYDPDASPGPYVLQTVLDTLGPTEHLPLPDEFGGVLPPATLDRPRRPG